MINICARKYQKTPIANYMGISSQRSMFHALECPCTHAHGTISRIMLPASRLFRTVLSDNMIVLLLTPGTVSGITERGISRPPMVGKRHDTDGRWRQLTKLPRPCPQYPPFTLGNGFYGPPTDGSWRFQRNQRWSQALRDAARAFDVILLTDRNGKRICYPTLPSAGSHSVRAWAACCLCSPAQWEKLEY